MIKASHFASDFAGMYAVQLCWWHFVYSFLILSRLCWIYVLDAFVIILCLAVRIL